MIRIIFIIFALVGFPVLFYICEGLKRDAGNYDTPGKYYPEEVWEKKLKGCLRMGKRYLFYLNGFLFFMLQAVTCGMLWAVMFLGTKAIIPDFALPVRIDILERLIVGYSVYLGICVLIGTVLGTIGMIIYLIYRIRWFRLGYVFAEIQEVEELIKVRSSVEEDGDQHYSITGPKAVVYRQLADSGIKITHPDIVIKREVGIIVIQALIVVGGFVYSYLTF